LPPRLPKVRRIPLLGFTLLLVATTAASAAGPGTLRIEMKVTGMR